MVRRVGSCSALSLLTAAVACFNPSDGPAEATGSETTVAECMPGEVRCSCFPNQTCNVGLDCVSEVCVDLDGSTTSEDSATSSGTGDPTTSTSAGAETWATGTSSSQGESSSVESGSGTGDPMESEDSTETTEAVQESGSESESTVGVEPPERYLAGGPIAALPTAPQGEGAGFAVLHRDASGTSGSVAMAGLSPDVAYPFYVHTSACSAADGGERYLIDPSRGLEDDNVIGSVLETDGNGAAMAVLPLVVHVARSDASSIVVFAADDTTRLYCVDLTTSDPVDPFIVHGSASVFSETEPFDARADLIRDLATGQTSLQISATGMPATSEFHLHLRTQACSIDSGGPYYKLDWDQPDGDQSNELWLTFSTDESGASWAQVSYDHLARADAMSGEIHPAQGGFYACMDFVPI